MNLGEQNELAYQLELSILLPSYNERETIVPLVKILLDELSFLGGQLEIIVIDDNSPDGTANCVNTEFANDSRVSCLTRTKQRGLAFSIKDGICRSRGGIILVMDSDFNHPPQLAKKIYNLTKHVDVVLANRFILGGGMNNKFRYVSSLLYNKLMRMVLNTGVDDNLSGLFAIKNEALKKIDFDSVFWGYGDYFFRLILQIKKTGLLHAQIPVWYLDRPAGQAKTQLARIFLLYTAEVLRAFFKR